MQVSHGPYFAAFGDESEHFVGAKALAAAAPWFGRRHAVCAALAASPPDAVESDDRPVWGKYAPGPYMACVVSALARDYRRQPGLPELYLRSDRAAAGGPAR